MQFITNGPDIPNNLLQAHEDGRVVFFCGAGISYPANLPGFKKLVDNIYKIVGTVKTDIEERAYTKNQYDVTLDLLERRLPGDRLSVRKALKQALQPKLRRKNAMDTHKALAQLARNREGKLRLITTNFDRIFEEVSKRNKLSVNTYSAPMLPIPKNSRWDGLVYLHGLLPKNDDESALHKLVLTSGDFGLAYLTERWAARFVSELFRNYEVCFVGYSIDDPVLRYMMDALAADRMLGEITPQAYAFGKCEVGREKDAALEWEAKGVVPILYSTQADNEHDHSALHDTLKAWAEVYRDGISGREGVVTSYANIRPSESTSQDDFVGRMLWALSHESGLPAKRFAEFNPVPPIEWLEVFYKNIYQYTDLAHFGFSENIKKNDKLSFSFINRPTPYTHAQWMSLVSQGTFGCTMDIVMVQLAHWLIRHLNDPLLIIWLSEHGGRLNQQFSQLIKDKLNDYESKLLEGKTSELDEIRKNAPNAIPEPFMCTLWNLLLIGRVKSPYQNFDLYQWADQFKNTGLTITLQLELRKLLKPLIRLTKPWYWDEGEENDKDPKQLINCEVVLASDYVSHVIKTLHDNENWNKALPELCNTFQQLLHDALDLFREIDKADGKQDPSHWDMPSISPHWQNRDFQDWAVLIELLRDSWIALYKTNLDRARQIARIWFTLPYPTFKRLALFAASYDNTISPDEWVEWFTIDDSWWLWAPETQRETMRLIVLQGAKLSGNTKKKFENAILVDPLKKKFRDNIEDDKWNYIDDYSIWLRLRKLQNSGVKLDSDALQQLNKLSQENPKYQLEGHEKEEFSHWMSGTGDPDYTSSQKIDIAPRKRSDLVAWLKLPASDKSPFYRDTWHDTCRTRLFHCLYALCDLAKEDLWPIERWRVALQVSSEGNRILLSWRFIAPLIQKIPEKDLQELLNSLTWWLESASKVIDIHETIFLDLCSRVLSLSFDKTENDLSIADAINHPIGHITQALLNFWFKQKPNDNDKLPKNIEPLFTQLCDTSKEQFRNGRIILTSQSIAFFRADYSWAEKNILPLFDWSNNNTEAKVAWKGFLWSPRLYTPLLLAFKTYFFDTAKHYEDLGKSSQSFVSFMTYLALNNVESYSQQDFQSAIIGLPEKGLEEVASYLAQVLKGAGEQREEYWRNRILPFWQNIWPKSIGLVTKRIIESLARLSIAAGNEFPTALNTIFHWLKPIEHNDYILNLLYESGLSKSFPKDTLRLLSAIIDEQQRVASKLRECLNDIIKANSELELDPSYKKLNSYLQTKSL